MSGKRKRDFTYSIRSHAGIDCGVARTGIVSVEGVRFAGGADLTTGREMTFLHFPDPVSQV